MTAGAPRSQLILSLAIVWLVWGSSYLATRIGVTHLPPLLFGGIRFVTAGLLLLAVAAWRGMRLRELQGEWGHVIVLGITGVACVNGLQTWAMQWVPSNLAALLNASCAFWIVLFGLFGRRAHRPSRREGTGIALGFAGTALLVWPGAGGPGLTPLIPQLAILLACVFWSLATILVRSRQSRLDVFSLTGAQMATGGLALLLVGFARGEAAAWTWSSTGLLAMAWLTLFSACFAYTAYTWLAKHASPAVVGTYGYVNPAIAALLGYLVLGERLAGLQGLGMAVILAGVVLINWPSYESIKRI
jgi:drug/metabolite transporter (DMT)-like permease